MDEIYQKICPYPKTKRLFCKANGIKFYVEREGDGPPLVLIHGGPGGNHYYFHPQLSRLAKFRTLFYYDLRGHGLSSSPTNQWDYGVIQDTKDLEALRTALNLDEIDVFGHSYGGIVAFNYGLTYPTYVKHLIFCSTPIDITDEEGDKLLELNPIAKELECATSEQKKVELYYKLYFHKPLKPEDYYDQEITRHSFLTKQSKNIIIAYERDIFEPDWKYLSHIKKPMLFLYGKFDPLAILERIKNITSQLNNAQLVIFSESGHDPFVDEPELFEEVVRSFLV